MNRSLAVGLTLLTLAACGRPALGAVTGNGSTVCDSNRVALAAIDASYTLTSNSDKIIYAAGANDPTDCDPRSGHSHTLQYRILAGSWANVPTSNGSGPFLASSGTVLSNNSTVTSAERRAKTTGTGSYRTSAREFTTSTSLNFSMDWDNDRTVSRRADRVFVKTLRERFGSPKPCKSEQPRGSGDDVA